MKVTVVPGITSVTKVAKVTQRLVGRKDSVLARKTVRESLVSVAGLIGRPVRDLEGRDIGHLVDIVVRHSADTYPPVSGLIANHLLTARVFLPLPRMKSDSLQQKLT